MTHKKSDDSTGLMIVSFIQKFTMVLAKQIEAVQIEMDESATNVLNAIQDLAKSTESKKEQAEKALEAAYLSPDAGTQDLVSSIQKSTDDIFEQAAMEQASSGIVGMAAESGGVAKNQVDTGVEIRRFGGLFSKHMESISTLDDSLQGVVMGMVGSMSNSDIVKQRLDHLITGMSAMHTGLSNILYDLNGTLNPALIADFKARMLEFTYSNFTMETEKAAFSELFGDPQGNGGLKALSNRKVG